MNGSERGVVTGDGCELFLRPFGRPPPVLSDLDLPVEDSRLLLAGEGTHSKLPSVEGLLLLQVEIKKNCQLWKDKINSKLIFPGGTKYQNDNK